MAEIAAVTQAVMSIIMPVFGMLAAFMVFCAGLMFLYSLLGDSR